MKKLLLSLSTIGIITTTPMVVISCSTNNGKPPIGSEDKAEVSTILPVNSLQIYKDYGNADLELVQIQTRVLSQLNSIIQNENWFILDWSNWQQQELLIISIEDEISNPYIGRSTVTWEENNYKKIAYTQTMLRIDTVINEEDLRDENNNWTWIKNESLNIFEKIYDGINTKIDSMNEDYSGTAYEFDKYLVAFNPDMSVTFVLEITEDNDQFIAGNYTIKVLYLINLNTDNKTTDINLDNSSSYIDIIESLGFNYASTEVIEYPNVNSLRTFTFQAKTSVDSLWIYQTNEPITVVLNSNVNLSTINGISIADKNDDIGYKTKSEFENYANIEANAIINSSSYLSGEPELTLNKLDDITGINSLQKRITVKLNADESQKFTGSISFKITSINIHPIAFLKTDLNLTDNKFIFNNNGGGYSAKTLGIGSDFDQTVTSIDNVLINYGFEKTLETGNIIGWTGTMTDWNSELVFNIYNDFE